MFNRVGLQNAAQNYDAQKLWKNKAPATENTAHKSVDTGKKVSGEEELSDTAKEYLNNLRKNHSDIDFFVTDYTKQTNVKDVLNRSTKDFAVIFSNEEIEKMASDEKYAAQKMQMVERAIQMSEEIYEKYHSVGKHGDETSISRIAFSFNDDGSMKIFAELENSSEKMEKRLEDIKEQREEKEKLNEKKASKKDERIKRKVVSASTAEELLEKINQVDWASINEEETLGSRIDFSV